MSSECNNVKLAIQNDKSKVVCVMCKQCLITANHDVCVLNYVNGMNSRDKKQKENVSKIANQKKHKPQVKKPKKVGSKERIASPKPSKPIICLIWSPTGRIFDLCGKIIESSDSKCYPNLFMNTRVYFVEGLGHNLFSVRQFCDSDLEVAFRRNTCFIRNLEGVDLLKGNHTTNLYTINLHEMAHASLICLMARATSTKSWLWHQRLSHLNFGTINDLAKADLVTGLPKFKYHKEHLCPSCEQGKSKRASHPPKPVPNSKQRLHLLHMDLCGPMRIASINGKRYVLVIVDDYSRYTWVHFLRSKDEAPEVIKTFLKRITVLLQSPVIIIRTDNGTEFKNQILKEYFDSVGISHQASSVRTPQQNGVVERRNRTLVEAARTMLIFSHAPLFLWAEAIATSCYTQNRSNDREDIGKLGAKGDIGFFIGYSADSCAYRVYNRRTKKTTETMNVTFDEFSAMAFEQSSSKLGIQGMTSGQISSGLDLTYALSTITTQQPTEGELDLLLEAMYDDQIGGQPSAAPRTKRVRVLKPEGFIDDGHPSLSSSVKKALYGFKHSLRAWCASTMNLLVVTGYGDDNYLWLYHTIGTRLANRRSSSRVKGSFVISGDVNRVFGIRRDSGIELPDYFRCGLMGIIAIFCNPVNTREQNFADPHTISKGKHVERVRLVKGDSLSPKELERLAKSQGSLLVNSGNTKCVSNVFLDTLIDFVHQMVLRIFYSWQYLKDPTSVISQGVIGRVKGMKNGKDVRIRGEKEEAPPTNFRQNRSTHYIGFSSEIVDMKKVSDIFSILSEDGKCLLEPTVISFCKLTLTTHSRKIITIDSLLTVMSALRPGNEKGSSNCENPVKEYSVNST
ncbi:retrovirus-related pol polyprotein from transposon TNT 1-94 [Tanacetum coccineum]